MKFQQGELLISHDYPHSLMLHILAIMKEKNISNPEIILKETFLDEFESRYAEYPNEMRELQVAFRRNLIQEFVHNKKAPVWRKRAFITVALFRLAAELKEWEAVELLESMMHLFHWEFDLVVKRKWKAAKEDRADFHSFQKSLGTANNEFEKKVSEHIHQRKEEKRFYHTLIGEDDKESQFIGKDVVIEKNVFKKDIESGLEQESDKKEKKCQAKKSPEKQRSFFEKEDGIGDKKMLEVEAKREFAKMGIQVEKFMSPLIRREFVKAKQGNALAQCHLGDFYAEEGTGYTDYNAAVKWYRFSARQGNLRAKLEIGRIFDSGKLGDENAKQQGIKYFMELAEEGYPTAQYIIGMKYYFGDGLPKDISKGILWMKKAAYQGCIDAQRQLGDFYASIDKEEAVKWYQMAKANGDVLAGKKMRMILKG